MDKIFENIDIYIFLFLVLIWDTAPDQSEF